MATLYDIIQQSQLQSQLQSHKQPQITDKLGVGADTPESNSNDNNSNDNTRLDITEDFATEGFPTEDILPIDILLATDINCINTESLAHMSVPVSKVPLPTVGISDTKPWTHLKTRMVSRAFYENAYLDFFLQYYLSLGFDNIIILKADMDDNILDPYQPCAELKSAFQSGQIEIVKVANTGNEIIPNSYKYFNDTTYDWILNIDTDEFLIIDLDKYPNGIKEFIYKVTHRIHQECKIGKPDFVQQIKFRWVCVNKYNNNWQQTHIHNKKLWATIPDTLKNTITQHLDTHGSTHLTDYILGNELQVYRYIKSMIHTKHNNNSPKINCHFFYPIPLSLTDTNGIPVKINYNLLDGIFKNINNSDPVYMRKDGGMLCDGFILHLNTRSLTNSITKCLVTQLRDNKKIKDMDEFRRIINTYSPSTGNQSEIINQFKEQLNSKTFLPAKMAAWNRKVSRFVNWPEVYQKILSTMQQPIAHNRPIVNIATENDILSRLCKKHNLDYHNMQLIINLF